MVEVWVPYDAEHVPVYVSDTVEQTPAHSNVYVTPLLHSVMVPSLLHTDPVAEHVGKQDDHQAGGFGAARFAQLRLSSICWHEEEMTRALNAPWQSATLVPQEETFEQNWEANEPLLPLLLLLLHATASVVASRQGAIAFMCLPPADGNAKAQVVRKPSTCARGHDRPPSPGRCSRRAGTPPPRPALGFAGIAAAGGRPREAPPAAALDPTTTLAAAWGRG
jgi:hypothetical protein